MVATAAEESQAPRRHIPKVLIAAVVGIALFWAFNAWVLTLSAPPADVEKYNAAGLTAITPVAQSYWGWGNRWTADLAINPIQKRSNPRRRRIGVGLDRAQRVLGGHSLFGTTN